MSRLFIAGWPPPSVADLLAELPREDAPGLRWTTPDQWHITLRYLGTVDEPAARRAFDAIVVGAAEAELGPAVDRLDSDVVMVPVAGLDDLAAAVLDASADIGPAPHPEGFRGHLTLARRKGGGATSADGSAMAARFAVDEIALVRSDLHPDGARYTSVARRRLPT